MPTRRNSRAASTAAKPLQNSHSPANSGRAMARIKQEAQDDADVSMAQLSSPAVQVPALDANRGEPSSSLPAPVIQYFLAEYYRNGEYSDLNLVSAGVVRPIHRIIVCSESPVLKDMCSNLRRDVDRLELNQYDPETLDRVLDFCYRRTYSDGEYPETVASFLTEMTADDIRDALGAPLVVVSDVEDLEWTAGCVTCGDSAGEDNNDGEYFPYTCDIEPPSEFDSEASDDEGPLVHEPLEAAEDLSQPPYKISLFANFKVYVAAKELQIPSLQLLARERFVHTLRSHWARFADLPALIEQIYLRTDQSDPLRALICQIVAAGYDNEHDMAFKDNEHDMAFKTEMRELMARNGEFATEVLDMVLRMRSEWAEV